MLTKFNFSKRLNPVVTALMLAAAWLPSISQGSIVFSGPVSGHGQLGPAPVSTNDLLPNMTYSDNYGTSYLSTSFIEGPSASGFRFVAELGGSLESGGGRVTHSNAYVGEIFNFTIDTSYTMSLTDSTFERFFTGGEPANSYGNYYFYVCETSSCPLVVPPGNVFQFGLASSSLPASGLYGVAWPPVTLSPGTYRVIAQISDSLSVTEYPSQTSIATQNILTADLQLAPAVVPIPAAAWLFGGALGALGGLTRNALSWRVVHASRTPRGSALAGRLRSGEWRP